VWHPLLVLRVVVCGVVLVVSCVVYTTERKGQVRARRARRVYYTTSLEYETEIEGGRCA